MPSQDVGFEGLLEAVPDAVVAVDRSGEIRLVNHKTETLFGFGQGALVGTPLELLVPESLDQVRSAFGEGHQSYPDTRPTRTDRKLKGLRRDGTTFPADITASSWETGGRTLVIAAVRDMSSYESAGAAVTGAPVRTHEQTTPSQAFDAARAMIEASLDSLLAISPEGVITDANEVTVKATGVPRGQLIGTHFTGYFTDPAKAAEISQRVFTEGRAMNYPLTLRHRDGTLTEALYNASVYRDASDKVLGVFAAGRDITGLIQAQSETTEQHTSELQRLAELERFQRLTVGRELKMIELKKENEFLRKSGLPDGGEPDDRP